MVSLPTPTLSSGAYTLPDAARLLGLPLARLRSWVRGTSLRPVEGSVASSRRLPAGEFSTRGEGRDRHFNFFTLIELFSIAQLRGHGVSMTTLRQARKELGSRFQTPYPFALQGLMTDKRRLLKEMGHQVLLELGSGGQVAFEALIGPFCHRIDFDASTRLAARYFPMGRDHQIVVDPRHAFGRPVVCGTNITTEALASLIKGGEKIEDIADDFRLDPGAVQEAWRFETRQAA
ncbi:MAG: DUF433 domain-containing protein [Candidatus Methylacidiphilales bacterium]|nr:DUF433 domain-containing protein [Candidatus Methylacidiphilales bacterium]